VCQRKPNRPSTRQRVITRHGPVVILRPPRPDEGVCVVPFSPVQKQSMFSGSVQPAIVSLFSSTGSEPLYLWSAKSDSSLPADSIICLLDDSKSTPTPSPPATLISPHSVGVDASGNGSDDVPERMGYSLTQTVLHIQSPSLTKTYLRCPPQSWGRTRTGQEGDLGLKQPWVHIQVRNMGRPWSFELGLVDQTGREGIVRCSTFQVYTIFPSTKSST